MDGAEALTERAAVDRGVPRRVWHAVLAAVITASLITQIVLLAQGGADVNTAASEGSIGFGARLVQLLSYFAIESNVLVLALAISLILAPDRDGRLWRVLHADALLGIIITGPSATWDSAGCGVTRR